MSRNREIKRIMESREIAREQNERIRKIQAERNKRRGGQPGLDTDNLYCRNSIFPWS